MSRGRDEGSPAVGAEPWHELKPGGSWEDLVLPEDFAPRLRELVDLARHSPRGADGPHRLLFAGPRGMGKTSVALALAADLHQSVLEVDVTELIAMDLQVDQLLNHSRGFDGLLVLDRADPLLRPRRRAGTPSDDRAAEVVRVLDDGAGLPGIVILCAERVPEDGPGQHRQFDQTFTFPEPSAEIRAQIWDRHLPADHVIASSDLAYIARAFRLSGKVIAACCGRARLRADGRAVTLLDAAAALDAEYENRLASDATRAALSEVHARARRADASVIRDPPRQDGPEAVPPATTAPQVDAPRAAPVAAASRPSLPPRELAPEPTRRDAVRRRWLLTLAVALVGAIAAVALGIALSNHKTAAHTTNSRSAPPRAVSVQVAYRTKLSQALGTLNQARARYGAALASAHTPTTQAQAAAALAAAHLVAASTLGSLNAGPAAAANQKLVAALRAAGNAYGALAQAAYKSDARSYANAKAQVATASAAVTAAVTQVQTAAG